MPGQVTGRAMLPSCSTLVGLPAARDAILWLLLFKISQRPSAVAKNHIDAESPRCRDSQRFGSSISPPSFARLTAYAALRRAEPRESHAKALRRKGEYSSFVIPSRCLLFTIISEDQRPSAVAKNTMTQSRQGAKNRKAHGVQYLLLPLRVFAPPRLCVEQSQENLTQRRQDAKVSVGEFIIHSRCTALFKTISVYQRPSAVAKNHIDAETPRRRETQC